MELKSNVPDGPIETKWEKHKFEMKLVNPANKRKYHVIVVGSGLGGLTVACLLSKVGYRVLVLEQHDVAGGATHTFTEQGFTFDVGVHYLGERLCSWWSPVRRLFDVASE